MGQNGILHQLINEGRSIEQGLTYVPAAGIRSFAVYRLASEDDYYSWKEKSIRFLYMNFPKDRERFIQYSNDFEHNHYLVRYISNMIGVLEACKEFPSEKTSIITKLEYIEEDIVMVESLEQNYLSHADKPHESIAAFHNWHAAACILFDKWLYPTDDDLIQFRSVDGSGNEYVLKNEFDRVYSSYKVLIARLKEGRNLRKPVGFKTNQPPKTENKINVFISYSHSDIKWLTRLKKHLDALTKYFDNIDCWVDTKLRGGDKWREKITDAIDNSNVAILLVSADFLASDFITANELPPILKNAEEKGTRVIPLIVSPCAFEYSPISEFQAINSPDKTLEDLATNKAATERIFLELIKTIQP